MTSILLAIVMSGPLFSEKESTRLNVPIEQLAGAYGFVLGQQGSLELIKHKFPDLVDQVNEAEHVFENSAFEQGFIGAKTMLAGKLGDKWPEFQTKMVEKIETHIDHNETTRDRAIGFLAEVKERVRGAIPDTIRATLLSAHPQYSQNPAREFLDGWKQIFETKGHAKSKGANFRIDYPTSWTLAEGERPNIVQKFVSKGGHGLETVMIVAKDLSIPLGTQFTEKDLRDLLSPAVLREMVPETATVIDAQTIEIENTPTGILEYTMIRERLGTSFLMHVWALNFLCDNTFVQIQFQVGGLAESETNISRRMATYKPLFRLMANSIVFPDKWTAQPSAEIPITNVKSPMTSPLPFYDASLSFMISAFVITWVVGLTLPLVIRYVIARHPLSKKAASWTSAGWCISLWIAEQVFLHAEGEQAGKITAVYIVMFGVARWIMSRGFESSESPRSRQQRFQEPNPLGAAQ